MFLLFLMQSTRYSESQRSMFNVVWHSPLGPLLSPFCLFIQLCVLSFHLFVPGIWAGIYCIFNSRCSLRCPIEGGELSQIQEPISSHRSWRMLSNPFYDDWDSCLERPGTISLCSPLLEHFMEHASILLYHFRAHNISVGHLRRFAC